MIEVPVEDFGAWRNEARALLAQNAAPSHVDFTARGEWNQPLLAGVSHDESQAAETNGAVARVPRDFLAFAQSAAMYRDPIRWNLLYSVLWRLTHGEPQLLQDHADAEVRQLRLMQASVDRDIHKMHAFVRFRQTGDGVFVAWYRPQHLILRAAAPFFVRRFGSMRWSILTPDGCAYWDMEKLEYGPGIAREEDPAEDAVERLWLDYYASIFNPARVNLTAMRAELPARHWPTLPEARIIGRLVQNAGGRVGSMVRNQKPSAAAFIPADATLDGLRQAARGCEGCELYHAATQTVFGEGPGHAPMMLVGEQPGDHEDREGHPFVGPAGEILDRALLDAGLDRSQIYVTNAVKHFHFEERGKRRTHQKPRGAHISACRPWLEQEILCVRPHVIVCMGATAAQSLVGRDVRVMTERGKWLDNNWAERLMITLHPSALLRCPPEQQDEYYHGFVDDLRFAREGLAAA